VCFPTDPSPTGIDEYYADSPIVAAFISDVRRRMDAEPDRARLTEELKPAFRELLDAQGWLPEQYAAPDESSGMGGGIGQYVLYRAGDRSLSLFSLVVPAGSSTPVHDHLAWGLVGLYQGRQHERVYRLVSGDPDSGQAELELTEDQEIDTGSFYALLPPDGDIHQVTTISDEPSISIHLLGNDTGCVMRHRYEPETKTASSFRSGYSNVPCEDGSEMAPDQR
jgi:3-mercaptopropionate dioxygenase